jgi:hypothetical protein
MVAPAAGLAVRISGTTQAAAPALAATDIRPRAWRLENVRLGRASPGATGDVPTSRFVACLSMSSARPLVTSRETLPTVLPLNQGFLLALRRRQVRAPRCRFGHLVME